MALAIGPTIASARKAGPTLNAVGSGQPWSEPKRIVVSTMAMITATAICQRRWRTIVRGSVIMKNTNSWYIGPVIGAISGRTG